MGVGLLDSVRDVFLNCYEFFPEYLFTFNRGGRKEANVKLEGCDSFEACDDLTIRIWVNEQVKYKLKNRKTTE